MSTEPAPIWPVEPTTFHVYSYYPTNGLNEAPTYNSNLFQSYNDALASAKNYITSQLNVGVCVIQTISTIVVYPSIPWVAV